MMIGELKRLLKHSAVYGFSNILSKAVGFIMIPVYTRYIPPSDYGLLELLDITMNVIGMFVGLGIVSAVGRFLYLYDHQKDKNAVVSSSIFFLSSLLFCAIVFGYFFSDSFSKWLFQTEQYNDYVKLSFITFAFNSILEIPFTYIRARERSVFFVIVSMSRLIVALSLNIYFVVFKEIGILGILYSGVITSVLFSTIMITWTLIQVGVGFNRNILWAMITFGFPLIFNSMGMFVINWGDRYFLNAYTTLEEIGIYSLGYKFGIMISFLIGQPFFMIWGFRRYHLIEEENGEVVYGKIFFIYSIILMYSWLCMSIFSYEIISIVADKRYVQAYMLIPIISLGYVFREFSDFFKGIFYIQKKTAVLGKITVWGAVYALVNYVMFIPVWGGFGAAVATLSTFIFIAVINLVIANKVKYINYLLMKSGLNFAVAAALFFCGYSLNYFDVKQAVAIKLAIILLVYPAVFYYAVLQPDERTFMQHFMNRRLNAFFPKLYAK